MIDPHAQARIGYAAGDRSVLAISLALVLIVLTFEIGRIVGYSHNMVASNKKIEKERGELQKVLTNFLDHWPYTGHVVLKDGKIDCVIREKHK